MHLSIRKAALGLAVGIGAAAIAVAASAADISGAGATFPYPVYAKWAEAYKQQTNVGLNYQSIGSGGGIKQITARTVTFGASDKPLSQAELAKAGLIQWPQIMGGVVPVINLAGIKPGEITLNAEVIANLYLGEITKWNDPQIAKLNPGVTLPSTAVAPVYRSDGSGTNFLFTTFLSQVSPKFKDTVGANTSVQWPAGIGAKGNEGVASMSGQTDGAIGYVEYAYVKQNKMTYAKMVNKAGKTIEPTAAAFQAAAANADWAGTPGFEVILTNQPGDASWPITGASFILFPKQVQDPVASTAALKFFDWSFKNGGSLADSLDYVPIPAPVVTLIEKTWLDDIKGADNQPLWK